MSKRTSFRDYACTAVALLTVLSSAGGVLAQQAVAPSAQPNAPANAATTSVEQGQTPLTDTFDFRDWRIEKRRKAFEDTKFEINFRTMFLDRGQFDGSISQAWAIGGWAGLKTGYFLDHVAFGITGYTSLPLHAPEDRDGTTLLKPGQEGYAVVGELYAEIRIVDDLILSVGRKAFDTPFINRNDTRMTPNTFEAIVLQGRVEFDSSPPPPPVEDSSKDSSKEGPPPEPEKKTVPFLKYGLGYFDKIKERNDDNFVSMGEDAGTDANRGVWAAGLIYEYGKFSIGAIDYWSEDIINIAYAEGKAELPLGSLRTRLAAQFVDQTSVGDNLLEGDEFSARQIGVKLELPVEKWLFTVAVTHAGGDTNLRNPWSGYPGYTSVQVQDFNRAGETAVLFRIGYDVPWVEGLSAYMLAVIGNNPDGENTFRQDEYDFNVQWAPPKGILKGLSLRARYAIVDQHGGTPNNLTDFRAIVNYVFKF